MARLPKVQIIMQSNEKVYLEDEIEFNYRYTVSNIRTYKKPIKKYDEQRTLRKFHVNGNREKNTSRT